MTHDNGANRGHFPHGENIDVADLAPEPIAIFGPATTEDTEGTQQFGLAPGACIPWLLEEGRIRAEGTPLLRPLDWRALQATFNELGERPEDHDPMDVVMQWPDDIEEVCEFPPDPIMIRRAHELIAAERRQKRLGAGDDASKETSKAESQVESEGGKYGDEISEVVELDSEDMRARAELSTRPLGARSRIYLTILRLRKQEKQLEAARQGCVGDASDLAALESILSPEERYDRFKAQYDYDGWYGRPDLNGLAADDRNSSDPAIDFLRGYPGLKSMREAIIKGALQWIMDTVKAEIDPQGAVLNEAAETETNDRRSDIKVGIKQERLRREVECGINTVLYGLVVDPEHLRRESDHKLRRLLDTDPPAPTTPDPRALKLKAFRKAARQLGELGGYACPSEATLHSMTAKTVEELQSHYAYDEAAKGGRLYVVPSTHNSRMTSLSLYKIGNFKHPAINEPGIRTTSQSGRNLPGRGLRLVRDYHMLRPAMFALEQIVLKHGRGPLYPDTTRWSAIYSQGRTIGGVAAFYAIELAFGNKQSGLSDENHPVAA